MAHLSGRHCRPPLPTMVTGWAGPACQHPSRPPRSLPLRRPRRLSQRPRRPRRPCRLLLRCHSPPPAHASAAAVGVGSPPARMVEPAPSATKPYSTYVCACFHEEAFNQSKKKTKSEDRRDCAARHPRAGPHERDSGPLLHTWLCVPHTPRLRRWRDHAVHCCSCRAYLEIQRCP